MEIFVGTSGWAYLWNPDGLEWYVKNSNLNAIELNASFYRYPYPNQVKGWSNKGKNLRWVLKVNRLVTHVYRFNRIAWTRWKSFEKLFQPLDSITDFYLFQLPPSIKSDSKKKIESFYKKTKLKERFALEWRNQEWFTKENVKWAKKLGLTLVSVDSPKLPRDVFNTSGITYIRMHGREAWYSHYYTDKELNEVKNKILRVKPEKVYVFFNNDTSMLENGRRMFELLTKGEISKESVLLKTTSKAVATVKKIVSKK
ncbi:MAG: DUF72 domain-containing protein [Candidatus Aenigmatarchaeota archaeon]